MLSNISNNLVTICDAILADQQQLVSKKQLNEYSKNGKKYKMKSDGNFVRVQGEEKHLVISESYEGYKQNYSILSSFHILRTCGSILEDYRKLSLAIIFTSREIELNKWYDDSSKICSIENSSYDPLTVENDALNYISNIDTDMRNELIFLGAMILTATKINFFQTDHNVTSPTLEGYALRRIISESCGEEALSSDDVYNALRAFSHWCSIRGIFHKLSIPNLQIDALLIHNFKSFPEIPQWVQDTVHGRYPAGCSKVALVKKALYVINNSVFGPLIPIPDHLNAKKLFELCKAIESDPLRYHVRTGFLMLSEKPPLEVSKLFTDSAEWIEFISCLHQAIGDYKLPFENNILISNKILKVKKISDKPVYKQTLALVHKMETVDQMNRFRLSNEQLIAALGGPVVNSLSWCISRYA